MAPVNGQPFLTYVIRYLLSQGIERFIFSLGHKNKMIEEFLRLRFPTIRCVFVVEDEPLLTGGAIRLALGAVEGANAFVLNADTLFRIDMRAMVAFHQQHQAECTVALKPMKDFDRFGVVVTDHDRIMRFEEKKKYDSGNINGGIYLLNKASFLWENWPDAFSLEKEYLEKFPAEKKFYGFLQDSYFIDIGIPEDYKRVQAELEMPDLHLDQIDQSWTLFLDRDGVINHDPGTYVLRGEDFVVLDGVLEALRICSRVFGRIIVITNQRAVGRNLLTEEQLQEMHAHLEREVEKAGGRIDAIYYCTSMADDHPDRKPNPGMAFRAKEQFPEIDFGKSIMIGDKKLDMEWARNIGAYAIWKKSATYPVSDDDPDVDVQCDSLIDFASHLPKP